MEIIDKTFDECIEIKKHTYHLKKFLKNRHLLSPFQTKDGTIIFHNGKLIHRNEKDGPAVLIIYKVENVIIGSKSYVKLGLVHRINGPAIIFKDEYEAFYINGELMEHQDYIEKAKVLRNIENF